MIAREDWLAERRRRIQSTDAAALCGLAPESWRISTPLAVYADKLGLLPHQPSNRAMRSGLLLEEVVAAMYEEETGRPLADPKGHIFTSADYGWQGATIDRFTASQDRVVELKTTRFAKNDDEQWGEPGTDEIPPHYVCQVQHQLAVTGLELADVAVLIGGQELRVYTVYRSDSFIGRLTEIEAAMWERIQKRDEPEPDWQHPSTPKLLDTIRQPVAGKTIDVDDITARALVAEYRDLATTIREGERRKDRLKCELLALIGDAETARFPDGYQVIRKIVKRKGYEVKPCEYVTLTVKEI